MFGNLSDLQQSDHAWSGEETKDARFGPVAGAEMAFALSLFVGAASGELAGPGAGTISATSRQECDRLLWALSRRQGGLLRAGVAQQYLSSLDAAFRGVWRYYEGDEQQASVCARVLGFYYLMEHSEGAVVERWVSACEGSEEVVVLHPVVVETLASIPLSTCGALAEDRFVCELEARAM